MFSIYFIEPFTRALKKQQQLIVAPARWTVSSEGSRNKNFGIAKEIKEKQKVLGLVTQ